MICFLCLKKSEILINIYDGLEEGFILLNIPKIIEKHVCFKPDKANPMLCQKCWHAIECFYIFCLKIETTHKRIIEVKKNNELKFEENDSVSNDDLNLSCDEYENISDSINNEIFATCINKESENVIENAGNAKRRRLNRKCKSKISDKIEENKVKQENEIDYKETNEVKNEEIFITDLVETNYCAKEALKEKKRTNVIRSADAVDEKISKYMTLSCDICNEQSPTLAALKTHFRLVHQQKGYAVCCNRKFKKRYLLIDHIDYHLNPEHFKCELCDKTFTVADSLKKHIKDIHETKERIYVQCDQCPKKFMRKSILLRHKAYHLPVESWKFPCEECGKIFPSKFYLTSHKTFSHNSLPTKICYVCGKPVPTNRYKKHMKSHDSKNEEEKVECEICKAKLNKKYINVHRQHHQEAEKEEFFCPICNHKSPNRRALYIHTRYTHADQRNHECHICQKKFKRKLALRQHMGTHTGNNLYSCPYCPKTFTYDSNFYMHKKKEHPKEIEIERQKQTRTNFTQHKNKSEQTNKAENVHFACESSIIIEDVKIETFGEFNNLQ